MTTEKDQIFAKSQLFVPKELSETIKKYCSLGTDDIENKPFRRQFDAWYLGFAIAIKKNLPPKDIKSDGWSHFIDGTIFDITRKASLELWALSKFGEDSILEPADTISKANQYAAAGLDYLMKELINSPIPLYKTIQLINELQESNT